MTASHTRGGPAGLLGVLHVHSSYSHDGRDTPERLHEFARARGIGFVALTDHAEDLAADEWDAYVAHCEAASDAAVRLIPGLEFRFRNHPGLHLLALGLRRWIAPATPAEFIELARTAARFTILAHPILSDYRVPDEVRVGIDAVEVWNATYNTRWLPDPRAIRLLHALRRARHDVVGTVGLDQHDARNDRQTRVRIDLGAGDPLEALRAGRFVNIGRTMRFGSAVPIAGGRLAALTSARWAFDRVERLHEWRARRRQSRRGTG